MFAVCSPLCLTPAQAATYYVAANGSDSSAGTSSLPFRTVAKGVTAASAGDTIILKDGTYPADTPYGGGSTSGQLLQIDKSGTPGSPITLKAEHKQMAILDCGNAYNAPMTGCTGYIGMGGSVAYWVFQDLAFTHAYEYGIIMNSAQAAHDILVKGCRFEHIGEHAANDVYGKVGVYANQGSYNLTFDGNIFTNIGRTASTYTMSNDHGLYLHSTNTTIINNVFYGVIAGWGVQTAAGFSGLIANNTFADTRTEKNGQLMLWDPAGAVTVQNNIFYNPPAGTAVASYAFSPTSCAINHNMVYGGTMGSEPACAFTSNVVANPAFVNASAADFHLLPNSSAIDAGVAVAQENTDFDGVSRPQGPAYDLGAFEYASGNAPTLAMPASAAPNPVAGTTTNLSVLGDDNGGEPNLTYTWATTGTLPAAVSFSANGINAAKNTTVTFGKAGSYSFQVTLKDAANLTATSSVNVTVPQTLATITVAPPVASVPINRTQSFSAAGFDQFNQTVNPAPSFAWSVSGGGSINSSGVLTAAGTAGGPFTVTAISGGKSGTAGVMETSTYPPSPPLNELPPLSLDSLNNKTFRLNDEISFSYPATGAAYGWKFESANSQVAVVGWRPGNYGSSSYGAAPSATTATPRFRPASAGLMPGVYVMTVTVTQGSQALSATARVTFVSGNLSGVKVYPNPWRSDKHASQPSVTFSGLTLGSTIKLFTISGRELKELHTDGAPVAWDLTNNSGDKVASGIYLYTITDSQGDKVRGKVAVVK